MRRRKGNDLTQLGWVTQGQIASATSPVGLCPVSKEKRHPPNGQKGYGERRKAQKRKKRKTKKKKKKKKLQHPDFARGPPPHYYPGQDVLNFADQTGCGALTTVWP
jgi:hypothetical protein